MTFTITLELTDEQIAVLQRLVGKTCVWASEVWEGEDLRAVRRCVNMGLLEMDREYVSLNDQGMQVIRQLKQNNG